MSETDEPEQANCADCLLPFLEGQRLLRVRLKEAGVLHGVRYKAGDRLWVHATCIKKPTRKTPRPS